MVRRISTKLLLAVLAAVIVPFVGFSLFVDTQMSGRLSRDVVLGALQGLAADLAVQIDRDVKGYRGEVRRWAAIRPSNWAIDDLRSAMVLDETGRADPQRLADERRRSQMIKALTKDLNAAVRASEAFDLILLVDASGELVTSSNVSSKGLPISADVRRRIVDHDYRSERWFQRALTGRDDSLDQHISPILKPQGAEPRQPSDYNFGFSSPVFAEDGSERVVGVVLGLVNWSVIQGLVIEPVLQDYFRGLVGSGGEPSAYGWVWRLDADTILAHPKFRNYGKKVSSDLGLSVMRDAALARRDDDPPGGLYPEYEFEGKKKNAAFRWCTPPHRGGFGWVVGVGIDNDDIFRGVRELRDQLVRATLFVLLISILWTMMIARRTTAPILELQRVTQRIAAGDLDARVKIDTGDELGELGEAFNAMTAELETSREQLIKAEKDAAWREMARQIAHDIKNPLTPIQLSADLLRRAKADGSPEFDSIFDRTLDTITRQVKNLREIASDFNALTGTATAQPQEFDAGELLDEVLTLNDAYAVELGVRVVRTGAGGRVRVDPALLRRVLINIVSNAFEAMPDGGELHVRVEPEDGQLAIDVRDTGKGLPEEVRAHLFEPYFTTRSTGTGLGLAIARRVIDEMSGTIRLAPAEPGPGTIASIRLPLAPDHEGA